MKICGGIDLHSTNSLIALLNSNGELVSQKRLDNNLQGIVEHLAPYQDSIESLVVESTYNWYWLVDGLMEAGYRVHLANTAAIQQYSGLKYTDDPYDARWLAELLRLGILPEGYICPKEERAVRDLMRKRSQLVHHKVTQMLSIQTLWTRNTSRSISANKLRKLTEEEVEERFPQVYIVSAVNGNLRVMRCLEVEIDRIEREVKQAVKLRPDFKLVKTVPGIGDILGLTIMLEAGTMHRFEKVGNFTSYCRCVATKRISNGKKKGAGNSKNGNKYLAWAFVEAANFAVRYNPQVKRYYQRKKAQRNTCVATKAVAHKLARACYFVLRDQVPFDVNKTFI